MTLFAHFGTSPPDTTPCAAMAISSPPVPYASLARPQKPSRFAPAPSTAAPTASTTHVTRDLYQSDFNSPPGWWEQQMLKHIAAFSTLRRTILTMDPLSLFLITK
ncbi:hypothetical protein IAR50_006717 [Cryptococcus sp. DSM 104548]